MSRYDLTTQQQKTVPFPECAKRCAILPIFGVSECEGCCPHKFDENGEAKITIAQSA